MSWILIGFAVLLLVEIYFRFDTKRTISHSALTEIYGSYETSNQTGNPFRLVIRFVGVSQWFLVERRVEQSAISLIVCLLRVCFADEDTARLQESFEADGFEFLVEPEESRFLARIPTRSTTVGVTSAPAAARATRALMRAIGLDMTARFTRGYDPI